MKTPFFVLGFVFLAWSALAPAGEASRWWPDATEEAVAKAGDNAGEWRKALAEAPEAWRESVRFLIENMPEPDLKILTAAYVLNHVQLAHEALEAAPWGKDLPREIFLNDVLPYACLNEKRDDWRGRLREISAPLVKDCKTPGEAAMVLNRKLFGVVNVKYSTKRRRPDQSPLESMENGLASCSGLSILLVDACRSVGVPARVAGTPMWANLRGNHTWVEVWDGGAWRFTGAAEPDGRGLDHGWFASDAAQAKKDEPRHAIYASSFKKTGLSFPLVWARRVDWVNAVNVTDRYTAGAKPAESGKVRILVKVLDRPGGKRVAAKVSLSGGACSSGVCQGVSRDESADLNNILSFGAAQEKDCKVQVSYEGRVIEREFHTAAGPEQVVTVTLEE